MPYPDGVRGGYVCPHPGCDYDTVSNRLLQDHLTRCPWKPEETRQ